MASSDRSTTISNISRNNSNGRSYMMVVIIEVTIVIFLIPALAIGEKMKQNRFWKV